MIGSLRKTLKEGTPLQAQASRSHKRTIGLNPTTQSNLILDVAIIVSNHEKFSKIMIKKNKNKNFFVIKTWIHSLEVTISLNKNSLLF